MMEPLVPFALGQAIRRRGGDPGDPAGVVVGMILGRPWLVLVRWRGAQPSFEVPENLDEVPRPVL
jgi:hypothetical protein